MRGKSYKEVKKKIAEESVDLKTAVAFVKDNSRAKFDETIDVHVRLGIIIGKSEQMVRGSVQLPHGTPKQKKIVVFTEDSKKQKAAQEAGASQVGGDDLITAIEDSGNLDADVTIASPDMMPKIAKIAKILGPKGLMPNPKTGTVTPDVVEATVELSGGKIAFKMDQLGIIHESVGKVSWEAEKIISNIEVLVEAIKTNRPATQKGEFLKSIVVSATMGPSVTVSS